MKACINKSVFNRKFVKEIIIVENGKFESYSKDEILKWYEDVKIAEIVTRLRNKNK